MARVGRPRRCFSQWFPHFTCFYSAPFIRIGTHHERHRRPLLTRRFCSTSSTTTPFFVWVIKRQAGYSTFQITKPIIRSILMVMLTSFGQWWQSPQRIIVGAPTTWKVQPTHLKMKNMWLQVNKEPKRLRKAKKHPPLNSSLPLPTRIIHQVITYQLQPTLSNSISFRL